MLFLDHDLRDAFDNVAGGNENLTATIYVAGEVPAERPVVLGNADAMTLEGLAALEGADDNVLVASRPQDIAFIMYTSGTTGPAKGVLMPHAHRNGIGQAARAARSPRFPRVRTDGVPGLPSLSPGPFSLVSGR